MSERQDDSSLSHGHSRLIWLLDDIEAHVEALREGTEAPELLVEELVLYVRSFSAELHEHIEEEERDIFPRALSAAGEHARTEVAELDAEHRRLEAQIEAIWAKLSKLCEGPLDGNGICFTDLFEQVRSIRAHLSAHSNHERAFLSRVEHSLAEKPTRSH